MAASTATSSNRSGTWFLCAIGLSLALIGGVFVWLMARSTLRALDTRHWPEVSCVILRSEIEERQHDPNSPLEFSHQVTYGYMWQGHAYTSDLLSLRGKSWSSKRDRAAESQRQFAIGKEMRCHVNPQQPQVAVLLPDSLAPAYSIWFPALFVIGGLGMVWKALRNGRSGPT